MLAAARQVELICNGCAAVGPPRGGLAKGRLQLVTVYYVLCMGDMMMLQRTCFSHRPSWSVGDDAVSPHPAVQESDNHMQAPSIPPASAASRAEDHQQRQLLRGRPSTPLPAMQLTAAEEHPESVLQTRELDSGHGRASKRGHGTAPSHR